MSRAVLLPPELRWDSGPLPPRPPTPIPYHAPHALEALEALLCPLQLSAALGSLGSERALVLCQLRRFALERDDRVFDAVDRVAHGALKGAHVRCAPRTLACCLARAARATRRAAPRSEQHAARQRVQEAQRLGARLTRPVLRLALQQLVQPRTALGDAARGGARRGEVAWANGRQEIGLGKGGCARTRTRRGRCRQRERRVAAARAEALAALAHGAVGESGVGGLATVCGTHTAHPQPLPGPPTTTSTSRHLADAPVQQARELQHLLDGAPVGSVEALGLEHQPRLVGHHLPDGREERDALVLRVNVVGQLGGRVVAEHEPKHNVSHERKVGRAEVVHLGGPRRGGREGAAQPCGGSCVAEAVMMTDGSSPALGERLRVE